MQATIEELRHIPLFKEADEDDLRKIAAIVERREYPEKAVIFWEGTEGRELLFVEKGEVIISRLLRGRLEHILARLGPGSVIGEVALLSDGIHRATAQAAEPTSVFAIDGQALLQIIENAPHGAARFFLNLARELIGRLTAANDKIREAVLWGLDATYFDDVSEEPKLT